MAVGRLVGKAFEQALKYFSKNGKAAAVSKFGGDVTKQLTKHFKDVANGLNSGQLQVQAATKGQAVYRGGQRKALALGAGTVGTVAVANNIKMRGQVKRATEQGQNNTASSEATKSVLKDDYAKLAGKMTPSEVARRKDSKPVNKNSSAQNSVAANRDRLAKTQAAEAKIQAELDRSARLGDKGPKQVEKTSKLAPKTSPRPKPRPKNK